MKRLLTLWPALGPALLAVLLFGRTVLGGGLEPAIGLAIAGVLVIVAVLAGRRVRLAVPLLLFGPIAFVVSPARTEMSFNLARPGDTGWFLFTVVVAVGIGVSIAAAVMIAVGRPAVRWAVVPTTAAGALGWALLVGAIDPQPDQGSDLAAARRAALPVVALLDYAYGVARLELTDGRLQTRLVNDTDRPHTFSVDALDLSVYVPGRREAVLDVAVPADARQLDVYCDVGDHRELGMVYTLALEPA